MKQETKILDKKQEDTRVSDTKKQEKENKILDKKQDAKASNIM